ncbi:family 16 glycoside hydrolase [Aquimarina algicola]|uniref:3-keto-alpha-glucoside-1,2-lyase/3-keto-2-hydroxy-glucal hydratase domain-containing protein n=1 Tax=Aquimarina algicola TaxID=2589995 RepID=A0A504J7P6_9FLAO|nr:family 16 glycoside hydrolase [Aquimarina algicola]TPN83928.1 hypothetical protein FHK87_18360 [Aquimarina algicola]
MNFKLQLLAFLIVHLSVNAQDIAVDKLLKEKGTLVFYDDFNRTEALPNKEDLGNDWVTNTKRISEDIIQCDLIDNTVVISMSDKAKHGVSMRHEAPFKNGVIQSKFRIFDKKGLGFNIIDRNYEGSSFGHICQVKITPSGIHFRDGKMGQFNWEAMRLKKSKDPKDKAKMKTLLKGTKHVTKYETSINEWHNISILYLDETIKVFIDDRFAAEYTSKGFAHPTKQTFAFSVWGKKAQVDDLKVWSIDKN